MKRIFTYFIAVAATIAGLSSCSNDMDNNIPLAYTATVTFKPYADGGFYIQQDDSTILSASNIKEYPFKNKKEKRAIIKYYDTDKQFIGINPRPDHNKHTKDVAIVAMDTIHTKNPVFYDSKADYGKDAIGLYLGNNVFPTTLIEDGYLNLCFNVPMTMQKHEINVVYGSNPQDPYELMITHNNNGAVGGPQGQAYLMCFPLKDLNVEEGKTVTVTLKWYSLATGRIETTKLKYTGRTDW